jgi:predicted dehydrogenase
MAAALDGKIELVCGAFSQNHTNTLETGRKLGLDDNRLYKNYTEMFEEEQKLPADERMEFVCIVTPNHLHVPVAVAAAKHGLTHTYLGYPMVWQSRHLVNEQSFGDVRRIYVEYPQGWLGQNAEAEGSKQAEWRTDPKRAGIAGCMGDIGSHAHSLVEFITGSRMTAVSARLRTHIEGRRLDDDGEISFTLANGATGVLTASQVCTGEENSLKIRVYGENAGIEWHQMEPNTLIERQRSGTSIIHRSGVDKPLCDEALQHCRLPSGHPEGYLEAFANLYKNFAHAIRNGDKETAAFVPGISEASRGMTFLEAIVESNQSDHKVIQINSSL